MAWFELALKLLKSRISASTAVVGAHEGKAAPASDPAPPPWPAPPVPILPPVAPVLPPVPPAEALLAQPVTRHASEAKRKTKAKSEEPTTVAARLDNMFDTSYA
jgi:hypothetical protein